ASRNPSPSFTVAGTARPTKATQARPGRMNSVTRNGSGAKTTTPTAIATASRRGGGATPATRREASTYAALRSSAPTVGEIAIWPMRGSTAVVIVAIAGPTPTPIDGQKCAP